MRSGAKRRLVVIGALLAALLCLGLRLGRGRGPAEAAAFKVYRPSKAGAPYDGSLADSIETVAENARYRLLLHSRGGAISVEDKATGQRWDSFPPGEEGAQDKFACPVSLSYLASGASVNEANNLTYQGLVIRWERIPDGVRVYYDATSLGIRVAVEYVLSASGLTVAVPESHIAEGAENKLVSIKLLRSFASLPPNAEGGLLVPDGCGAMRDIHPHETNYLEFGSYYYGGDIALNRHRFTMPLITGLPVPVDWKLSQYNLVLNPREHLTLPIYGIYTPRGAVLAVIERGAADCALMAHDDGTGWINYYRIGPEFFYRKVDQVDIFKAATKRPTDLEALTNEVQGSGMRGNRALVSAADLRIIGGERRIAYHLLGPSQANFRGLVDYYRTYLRQQGGLPPRPRLDKPRLHLDILCAVDQNNQTGRRLFVLTTFAEARRMVASALRRETDLVVSLYGWQRGGYHGYMPRNAEAEPKLGGNAGLRQLIAYCHAMGVEVRLELNYAEAFAAWHRYSASKDLALTTSQDAILLDFTYPNTRTLVIREELSSSRRYLTNLRAMLQRYVRRDTAKLAAFGADGYILRGAGEDLWSDLSRNHRLTRAEAIAYWRRIIEALRDGGKEVYIGYGQAYLLDLVDGVEGLALGDSRSRFFDRAVPLLPAVISGSLPYTGSWGNLRADGRRQFLEELAMGAWPRYLLTYRPSSLLIKSTLPDFRSTSFAFWLTGIMDEWREVKAEAGGLYGLPITDYETPEAGCSVTVFADTWLLLVNTTDQPRMLRGETVPPKDFIVARKETRR